MIKLLNKNPFLSISIKNSSQIIIRVLIGLLSIKIVAVILGPVGLAIVNQMQNFLQLTANLANGGIYNGIIKLLSDKATLNSKKEILNTGYVIIIVASLTISLSGIFFNQAISIFLFGNDSYRFVILCLFIYVIPTALFNFVLSITNGLQNLRLYLFITISYLISGLIIFVTSLYIWGLFGALWALLLQGLIAYILFRKGIKKLQIQLQFVLNKDIFKILSNYSLMAIVSNAITPLVVILIRRIIISNLSLHDAGIWDGVYKISSSYVNLSMLSFSYYFLPAFSKTISTKEIRKEIRDSLKVLIPLLSIASLSIYLFRDVIIRLILSNSFEASSQIIKWQLIGDIFAVTSWLFRILLIAKEKTKAYIFSEILAGTLLLAVSYYAIKGFGIEGCTIAYCIVNLINLFVLFIVHKYYWKEH
ncbi:O-antigen translocase [Carboxylicivirga sediminis]|uniref:O-antigen translocase n=1 Tax=Carboxylicivirga sediminis TaxID=2006564 RepID=A0A941IXT1_9BACT|nr:O-antigen translocase [Carboxylicivirga sediminis]MBR8535062.1 O-antigen translocase [Carboxylicivirga sediminis]